MAIYTEIKFLGLLSSRLSQYKRKDQWTWKFRCPFCMDSQKSKIRARGYVYKKSDVLVYYCHNCTHSTNIGGLLKHMDEDLWKEYRLENYKDNTFKKEKVEHDFTPPKFEAKMRETEMDIPSIDTLPDDHIAVQYLNNRKIPKEFYNKLYYTENYFDWIKDKLPNAKEYSFKDDKRIVIPFYDQQSNIIAYQGRSIRASDIKYITMKTNENAPKIFGLDRWNPMETTYIVEGPFDAMFLPNSLAMAGTDSNFSFDKDNVVYVLDNERRSKEVVNRMDNLITNKYKIVIWPDHLYEKDVNEMVIKGKDPLKIIQENVYSGISGTLKLTAWKRV